MKIYRGYGQPVEKVETFSLEKEMSVKKTSRSNFMNTLGDQLPDQMIDVYVTPSGERFTLSPEGDAIQFPYTDTELGRWNSNNTVKYDRV